MLVSKMMTAAILLAGDKKGVTAIEYAVLAGAIATTLVLAFGGVGTALTAKLTSIINGIN